MDIDGREERQARVVVDTLIGARAGEPGGSIGSVNIDGCRRIGGAAVMVVKSDDGEGDGIGSGAADRETLGLVSKVL